MCGQTGVCGSISVASEKAFQRLLIYNSVRGIDSTGAASVPRVFKNNEFDVTLAKELGHPFNLLEVKRKSETDFGDVLAGTHRVLLGHNRAATKGAVSRRNAHPFAFDTIVGTHNGSLDHWSWNKLDGFGKFDTDSECIFNEIEAYGIKEAVKKLSGAWALVWYDFKDNTINFLRNKERPLSFAFDKEKKQLFWSSERGHLVAGMSEIPHEEKYLYELPVDEHYSWEVPQNGKEFGKAKVVHLEGHQSTPFQSNQSLFKQESRNGKTYYPTNTGTSGNTGNQGTSGFSWIDTETHFWIKWNIARADYDYSMSEHGVYYPTPQEVWDKLFEREKLERLESGKIPKGVETGYYYDDNLKKFFKEVEGEVVRLPSLIDKAKEERFQEQVKEVSKETKAKIKLLYKDQNRKVYWNDISKKFDTWTYTGNLKNEHPWSKSEFKNCPDFVPFTKVDINARHSFKHSGKGNKKTIFYRGYNKALLCQKTFEGLMELGCLECSRKPQWGNEVLFVSANNFLCEHCCLDEDTVKAWRLAAS